MKLCNIYIHTALTEGFRMDTSGLSPEIISQELQSGNRRRTLKHILRSSQKFYYSPQDSPEDIVQVQKVMQEKNLEGFIDQHHLPTFDGKILYIFATSETTPKTHKREYRDQVIDQMLKVLDQAKHELIDDESVTSLRYTERDVQILIRNPELHTYGQPRTPEELARLEEYLNLVRSVLHIISTIQQTDPEANVRCARDARKYLLDKIGRKYERAVAYAFADVLKHPSNPEEEQLRTKFMELCEEVIVDWVAANNPDGYHFIVYPKSDSDFNTVMAARLVGLIGPPNERCKAIQVNKLKVKDATIDWGQMYERGLKLARRHFNGKSGMYVRRLRHGYREFKTAKEFAKDWADEESNKLKQLLERLDPNQEVTIKRVDYLDKRRYIKMFDPAGLGETVDKRVLIIDDNVVGGSTIELIYEIMRRMRPPPERIDIIVPLRIMQR